MKDQRLAVVIEELTAVRKRAAELEGLLNSGAEGKPAGPETEAASRDTRADLHADVQFIGDFDIVAAKGINISKGGVCFETASPLVFEMAFALEGEHHRYKAHMVWMKKHADGSFRYGFQFVQEGEPDHRSF